MTRVLTLLLSLAAASGAPAQDASAARERTIRGQAVGAAQNAALRRARVVVSSGNRQIEQVFTDDEGRFVIAHTTAGQLSVRVSKAGYTAVSAEADGGSADVEIRFALARSVAVMGRVLGADGLPLERAHVIARALLPDGRRLDDESARFFAQTDRVGEYRLGALPAGRYEVIAVRVPPEQRQAGSRIEEQLFGPPDGLESAPMPAIVALAPGAEASNVDFLVDSTPDETCLSGSTARPSEGSRTGAIRGRVTTASGEPLACATVRIVAADAPVPEVFTDRQGRYAIDGLPPGSFVLEARDRRYLPLQYGQRSPSDAATPIALRAGEERTGIDFALPRPSFIIGTVVDEHGEPVEGISVSAFQPRRVDGRIAMAVPGAPSRTDDRGRYRVTVLVPGTYVVATMARGMVSSTGAMARGYISTFHPGTSDVFTAARVTVDAGRDARGVDIPLVPRRLATVSGAVVDAAGRPFAGTVSLSVSARSGAASLDSWSVSPDAGGAFVIRNVPPGDYVVKAIGAPGGAPQFGMQYVSVIDADPQPVTIVTAGGATIVGTVEAPPDADLSGLTVSAISADFDYSVAGAPGLLTTVTREFEDGRFRVSGVTGPSRLIAQMPSCESCYLKSVYVNGRDAADTPFDFGLRDEVYGNVEVVISDAGAVLEGRVTADGDAGARAAVVVFSAFRDLWYSRSRHVRVGPFEPVGPFRVTGLPPGDYFAAAITRTDALALDAGLAEPEILQQLSARAQRVTLAERERRTVALVVDSR